MKVEKTKDNLKKCMCGKCPSYSLGCKLKEMPSNLVHLAEGLEKQDHFEGLFCAFGKSNCIKEDKGCLCVRCPLTKEDHLKGGAYCFCGPAK